VHREAIGQGVAVNFDRLPEGTVPTEQIPIAADVERRVLEKVAEVLDGLALPGLRELDFGRRIHALSVDPVL
jgi:hypothetical protein